MAKTNYILHPQDNRDKLVNYFNIKPEGIIVHDTYNNDYYPFDKIVFDKAKFELPLYKEYIQSLIGFELQFLPFHFFIEFIENDYYILNTRPIQMKPLIPPNDKYINYIHICILGDTNRDIYDKSLYKKIKSLLNSLSRIFNFGKLNSNFVIFKTGKNFNKEAIFM